MRKVFLTIALALCALPLFAQAATRPVKLSWTASSSTTVTGYSIYKCTIATGTTTCTPVLTGTPLGSVTGAVLTYTDNATTLASYSYSIVATAPACSSTSDPTVACGNSGALNIAAVPVPPQTTGATNIVIVVQ